MHFEANQLYHVYNQGNNHQKTFLNDEDYGTFLNYVKTLILPSVEMIAYCLMPNHFHFLVYPKDTCRDLIKQGVVIIGMLNNGIRNLLSGYCRIFNKKYNRSGSLFRQKTKAKEIGIGNRKVKETYTCEEYCYNCFRYIHYSPVEAGLVKLQSDWKWSSAKIL